jgi:hypothetical protein
MGRMVMPVVLAVQVVEILHHQGHQVALEEGGGEAEMDLRETLLEVVVAVVAAVLIVVEVVEVEALL